MYLGPCVQDQVLHSAQTAAGATDPQGLGGHAFCDAPAASSTHIQGRILLAVEDTPLLTPPAASSTHIQGRILLAVQWRIRLFRRPCS